MNLKYRGRTSERVKMFLMAAPLFKESEPDLFITGNDVYLDSNKFATFSWEGDTDKPIFELEVGYLNHIDSIREGVEFVKSVEFLLGRPTWSESDFQKRLRGVPTMNKDGVFNSGI